ncbi:carboxy terminal-processing peptidase [Flectobacillus sp. BAB-3569]|nr:carboxy terminal-processing peptidase [Flectobacillus sp. BAB-3569]
MIATSKYTPSADVNEQIVSSLNKKYQEHLKSETDLKKLVADFDYWKKAKERKTISLKEDKRRKEIEEQKKRNSQDLAEELADVEKPETKTEVKTDSVSIAQAKQKAAKERREKDAYLKETERLLTDYIFLAPSNGIKITQNKK